MHKLIMHKKFLLAVAGATFIALGIGEVVQAATFDVVAKNLDNPRGFTFGPDGALYVTEAGRGGKGTEAIASPSQPGVNLYYGPSGAVTRVYNGVSERVVTGLPSLGLPNGNGSYGPHDIAFNSNGKPYVLVGFAANPSVRDQVGVSDFGQVLAINSLNGGSSWTSVADLAKHELLNNPDGGDVISNPYSFVIEGKNAFVVDAGANDILRVALDTGKVTSDYVFPTRNVINPISGQNVNLQAVPDSITKGPNNAYYVSEFTGIPLPDNQARIYEFTPGQTPQIYADGFTQIIDTAFDKKGDLYVLEYAAQSLLPTLSNGVLNTKGELIRLGTDGTRTTILNENDGLISPTSLAFGPDDALYISNYGTFAGQGEVIRLQTATAVPENTSILSVLGLGLVLLAKCKYKSASS
jgi:hypothetical protein